MRTFFSILFFGVQWAGSCWYYLRFLDPENPGKAIDPEIEKYWMPVDMYVGGAEHAVLHLLYARFWHKGKPSSKVFFLSFFLMYLGGAEHAELHLLYARFWHKGTPSLNVLYI